MPEWRAGEKERSGLGGPSICLLGCLGLGRKGSGVVGDHRQVAWLPKMRMGKERRGSGTMGKFGFLND